MGSFPKIGVKMKKTNIWNHPEICYFLEDPGFLLKSSMFNVQGVTFL